MRSIPSKSMCSMISTFLGFFSKYMCKIYAKLCKRKIDNPNPNLSVLTIHQHTGPNLQKYRNTHRVCVSHRLLLFILLLSIPFSLFLSPFFHAHSSHLVMSHLTSQTLFVSISLYICTDDKIYSELNVELVPPSNAGDAGDAWEDVGEWGVPAAIKTTSSWSHQVCDCRLCGSPIPAITHMIDCNL